MAREALNTFPDIKIITANWRKETQFILPSDSKTTTAQIIKALGAKGLLFVSSKVWTIQIISEPAFKYLITLKAKENSTKVNTYHPNEALRKSIKQQLNCSHIFIKNKTIEIWSNSAIPTNKLKQLKLSPDPHSIKQLK